MFNFFKKLRQRAEQKVENIQPEEVLAEPVVSEVIVDEIVQEPIETESIEISNELPEPEPIVEEIQPEPVAQEVFEEEEEFDPPVFKLSFDVFKDAISKTTEAISGGISSLVSSGGKIDDDMLDELEEILIKADVGLDLASEIVGKIRVDKDKITTENLNNIIKADFKKVIEQAGSNELNYRDGLNIFLITGVNGAGKTTLIGKLAYRFQNLGAKVLVAAGDTFRAAAEEQLDIWSKRAGADIVRRDGADSASVVYDAIKKAKEEDYDVLLIDTAGRLQNKFNLMEELKKIKKVIDNEASGEIAESILVLDANTGQNGLLQAEVFKEAVQITAVGLTKLDGSAKGGIIAGIAKKLDLPVKLIGVGEKMEDLKDFDSDDFVEALFGR